MEWIDILRWLHVMGACVLIGTGAGIAFFMLMAHRTGDPIVIVGVARIVVIADTVFTASAAIVQPITGTLLILEMGHSIWEFWLAFSLLLYGVIGACWLPVVWIQIEMRKEAERSLAQSEGLSDRYHRLFKIWFALGFPAFLSIAILLWLMLSRPVL